jgi:AraC-like DNA-binding protein
MCQLAQEISGRADAVPYFRATVLQDADLAERLNQLHLLLRASQDRLQRESALYAVFSAVLQRHMSITRQPVASHPLAVERVRALLADRLAENLSLRQLAEAVELSPYYLNRVFRQRLGLPPVAWRNQLRVARARTLLGRGSRPAEVAAEVGFADQAHLTRAFRHALGVTPAAYQRAIGARSFKTGDSA